MRSATPTPITIPSVGIPIESVIIAPKETATKPMRNSDRTIFRPTPFDMSNDCQGRVMKSVVDATQFSIVAISSSVRSISEAATFSSK